MGIRDLVFLGVLVGGAGLLAASLRAPSIPKPLPVPIPVPVDPQKINEAFVRMRGGRAVEHAPPAAELAVFRRLSLALTGAGPSLEEIRRFESDPEGHRIDLALDERLNDRRVADYMAERLSRVFVGTEDGPFIRFRRRRFVSWLGDAIHQNMPYDKIVQDMIADRGLWTDHPATNFITVTFDPVVEKPDPERLAARVARAFLGARIDCAQCHDHPFEPWKQTDFRGLAAFFGSVHADFRGVRETEPDYQPVDRKSKIATLVEPRFPFQPEIAPTKGTPRERLASWVVDRRNLDFARATTNRIWALMVGRPLVEPVDDLASVQELPEPLTLLADDFAANGYDLRRLIRLIVATDIYRSDSTQSSEGEISEEASPSWRSFPLSRLRPEQVAGSIYQSTSVTTLGPDSFWLARLTAYNGRNDFVKRYGDTGEDEFDGRGGTIPQRLLMMNGELVRDRIKDELFHAPNQIASLSPNDRLAVEVAYLSVLTRRPTPDEAEHFEGRLKGTDDRVRKDRLTDLYWTLLNASEFSWNH